eukprot:2541092-Pyramimonas_sp.AAC.1
MSALEATQRSLRRSLPVPELSIGEALFRRPCRQEQVVPISTFSPQWAGALRCPDKDKRLLGPQTS